MKRQWLICFMILVLAACSGPSKATPTATTEPLTQAAAPTPTLTAIPTLTPTPFPTATNTPAPTFTPTATLRPTATRAFSLTPTATPAGFMTSKDYGFTLVRSSGWDIQWESGYFKMVNDTLGMLFMAVNYLEKAATPLEKVVASYRDPASKIFSNSQVDSQSPLTLADGTRAQEVVVKGKATGGRMVSLVLLYARQASHTYVFTVIGPMVVMDKELPHVRDMLKSIQLGMLPAYGIQRDQTLVLLSPGDPEATDLDPALTRAGAGKFAGLLFSGLVRLTPQMEIAPDLAESWTVSEDGTVYTFTLRKDLAFQNGRPLAAADVKYSWERAADPQTGSTTAATYLGDIQGVKEKLAGKADEISGVRVVDPWTLAVTLDGPKPYFLGKLSFPVSFVVDREAVEDKAGNWPFKPNASGPFTLREFDQGRALIFERNPNYYRPSRLAYIAYLSLGAGSPLNFYEGGEIDLTDWFSKEDVATITRETYTHSSEVQSTTSLCTSLIQLNNSLPPMDDPNVRKALALAIDQQRLVDQFYGKEAIPAQTILPPGMPGFSTDLAAGAFDPKAAKAALAASSYAGKLPEIVLTYQGYADAGHEYIDALVAMWQKNLGIKVTVQYVDPAVFDKTIREAHGQMVFYSWCANYPDPENFLDLLYHSGGEFNVSGYANPAVDALLEQARVESEPDLRLDLYKKVESMLLADFAAIPLDHEVRFALIRPGVQGFTLAPIDTRILDLMWLE